MPNTQWGLRGGTEGPKGPVEFIDGRKGDLLTLEQLEEVMGDGSFDWTILAGREVICADGRRTMEAKIPDPRSVDPGPRCPSCGGPMETASVRVCLPGGRAEIVHLPPSCPSADCAVDRDEAALERAIERGLVTR